MHFFMWYIFNHRRDAILPLLNERELNFLKPELREAVAAKEKNGYRVYCIGRGNLITKDNRRQYDNIRNSARIDYEDIILLDYYDPKHPARYDWAVMVEAKYVFRDSSRKYVFRSGRE